MKETSGYIERRSCLAYDEFVREYLYPARPVIFTDALKGWAALRRWTPAFFKDEFGDQDVSLSVASPYRAAARDASTPVSGKLGDFIDAVLASTDAGPAPYLRNQDIDEVFPSLRPDIEPMPEHVFPNWLDDRYLVGRVGAVLNRGAAVEIYIGGAGGRFPTLHYDGAAAHAFLMQIYGRKRFVVFDPDQEPFLYPAPEKPNLSQVDIDRPDLDRFPLFSRAVPLTFVLEPGEMLFVPSRWWHTTTILTPSITVSVNVLNESNWGNFVSYVARRQANPVAAVASRAYLAVAGARRTWRDRRRRLPQAGPGRSSGHVV